MDIHCPIKFNRVNLPRSLHRLVPNIDDPRKILRGSGLSEEEFSKYVSTICTHNTWRTTEPMRHSSSDDLILKLMSEKSDGVILDVGVSDGSTSLSLIERLGDGFKKYFAADRRLRLYSCEEKGAVYFYDSETKTCFMVITDRFVIYYDRENLLFPLKWLANFLISRAPKYDGGSAVEIDLCQPRLMELAKKDRRIKVLEWNMFDPWPHEKIDLIKIANVLNRSYFTNHEISAAVENLRNALKPGGTLLIVENRAVEQWSHFTREGSSLKLVREEKGGSDIAGLVKGLE
jgi:hypothetical protein